MNNLELENAANWMRYWILKMTSTAKSGHVTSSLSAADLMAVLIDGNFIYDIDKVDNLNNDRLIFSKGHATPLYYAFWSLVGGIEKELLLDYRQMSSNLEGHPTPLFPHTIAATGSLGMGLGIGTGVALGLKKISSTGNVWVLLGDGELAEGSVWESAAFASQHNLNNLVALVDINRLGQSGETAYGWNDNVYKQRFEAFGWRTINVDGHNLKDVKRGLYEAKQTRNTPVVILAKTVKGKGVSFLENVDGWHGKALNEEECKRAIKELGQIKHNLLLPLTKPKTSLHGEGKLSNTSIEDNPQSLKTTTHNPQSDVSIRETIGQQLAFESHNNEKMVVIDGDVKNSTYTELVQQHNLEQFIQTFIAEQQMVELAIGLDKTGFSPIVDTFAAFLTRAHDQIRMAAVSKSNILFIGTHVGVSIGADGPSQMGLEDIALFRTVDGSVIASPADSFSATALTHNLIEASGIRYIRATRQSLPSLYNTDEIFEIGKSKILRNPAKSKIAIIATGAAVHAALNAHQLLLKDNINSVIVDCYSIKPIDKEMLKELSIKYRHLFTIEDHWCQGGLGDAVLEGIAELNIAMPNVHKIAITGMPKSGSNKDLMSHFGLDAKGIIKVIKNV